MKTWKKQIHGLYYITNCICWTKKKKIKQYKKISQETQVNNKLLFWKFTGFAIGYGLKFDYTRMIPANFFQQTRNLIFNVVEITILALKLLF